MVIEAVPNAPTGQATVALNPFAIATRKQAKLRLALEGPAGYGKTYSALSIATGLLMEGQRIAFIDTEAGSSNKYSGGKPFDFDAVDIGPPHHPRRFVQHITDAWQFGYGVVILDSLSHAWAGSGGTLDIVDELAKIKYRGDSHRAWKEGTEIQQELVEAILRSPIHIIACMRTKADYVREERDDGSGKTRTVIRKAGMKTIQRDEFDYEFDIVGRFDTAMVLTVVKSRYASLPPETVVNKPGAEFAKALREWLSEGTPLPLPLNDADRVTIKAAIEAMGERKADGKRAVVEQIREFGYRDWDDFVLRGHDHFSTVLDVIRRYQPLSDTDSRIVPEDGGKVKVLAPGGVVVGRQG